MILRIKLFSDHIILIAIHIQKTIEFIEFDEFLSPFSLRNKFDYHGSKNNQLGNLKCNKNPRLEFQCLVFELIQSIIAKDVC